MTMLSFVLAASEKINPGEIGYSGAATNANTALTSILNTVYTWAGIVCVLVIIIAGYFYTTSAAEASQLKRAKNAILGACIGLGIIIMAFGITQFVIGRF